ncbi:hypothetical protein PM082_002057 [Marasmius tenuissimus]|nr:hypothetical protein PM082_002057 [Marasmius tenuissimus]
MPKLNNSGRHTGLKCRGSFNLSDSSYEDVIDSFNADGEPRNIERSFNLGTRRGSSDGRSRGQAENVPMNIDEPQTLNHHHSRTEGARLGNQDSSPASSQHRNEGTSRRSRGHDSHVPRRNGLQCHTTPSLNPESSSQYRRQADEPAIEARPLRRLSRNQRTLAQEALLRDRKRSRRQERESVRATQHHSQDRRQEPYDDYVRLSLDPSREDTGSAAPYRMPSSRRVPGHKRVTVKIRQKYGEAERRGVPPHRPSKSKREHRRSDGSRVDYEISYHQHR